MHKNYFVLFFLCCFFIAGCSDDDNDSTGCEKDDFIGVWNMNEECGVNDFQYPLTVTELASGIRLSNLGGLGVNAVVDAAVDGASFTIAPQLVQGVTLSGNGSLNAGCAQLTISWQGGPNGSCVGTGTK